MVNWAFDLDDDWAHPDLREEECSWVARTRQSANPPEADILYSSSGRFDNRSTPVVRLRWTDRDLVALAAD
jgi:hypothetical protein